jgi:hypothetical protein
VAVASGDYLSAHLLQLQMKLNKEFSIVSVMYETDVNEGMKIQGTNLDMLVETVKSIQTNGLTTVTEPQSYSCTVGNCKKEVQSEQGLKKHMESRHSGNKPYKCDDCQKSFLNQVNLNVHKNRDRCGKKKNFQCDSCDAVFWSRTAQKLQSHKESKHKESYSCEQCNKFTSTTYELMRNHKKNCRKVKK